MRISHDSCKGGRCRINKTPVARFEEDARIREAVASRKYQGVKEGREENVLKSPFLRKVGVEGKADGSMGHRQVWEKQEASTCMREAGG